MEDTLEYINMLWILWNPDREYSPRPFG